MASQKTEGSGEDLSRLFGGDPDMIPKMLQFTKSFHRDVYPAIDAKNPKNSAVGKSVLITGGGRGIGKGIALVWAAAGADTIIITGRTEKYLNDTAEEIKKASPETKVLALPCNVIDTKAVAALFKKVKDEVGKLDVLICNVGGMKYPGGNNKMGEVTADEWWGDVELNFKATVAPIHAFLTTFGQFGTIISISSGAAAVTLPGESAYSIAKMSNHRTIEYLNVEYPSIRAFSVAPGVVKTPDMPEKFWPIAIDTMELVGGTTLYLSTERADYARGGWVNAHWDVEEMEEHGEEIKRKGLLKTKFLTADLGAPGHKFESEG